MRSTGPRRLLPANLRRCPCNTKRGHLQRRQTIAILAHDLETKVVKGEHLLRLGNGVGFVNEQASNSRGSLLGRAQDISSLRTLTGTAPSTSTSQVTERNLARTPAPPRSTWRSSQPPALVSRPTFHDGNEKGDKRVNDSLTLTAIVSSCMHQ